MKAETSPSIRIRTYSKSQLASFYLPDIQTASARRTLRGWDSQKYRIAGCTRPNGIQREIHPAYSGASRVVFPFFRRTLIHFFLFVFFLSVLFLSVLFLSVLFFSCLFLLHLLPIFNRYNFYPQRVRYPLPDGAGL